MTTTTPDPEDAGWRAAAACRHEDPELFFPDGTTGVFLLQIEQAKSVCRRCPSLDPCHTWALDAGIAHALSEAERRNLLARRRRARTAATAASA